MRPSAIDTPSSFNSRELMVSPCPSAPFPTSGPSFQETLKRVSDITKSSTRVCLKQNHGTVVTSKHSELRQRSVPLSIFSSVCLFHEDPNNVLGLGTPRPLLSLVIRHEDPWNPADSRLTAMLYYEERTWSESAKGQDSGRTSRGHREPLRESFPEQPPSRHSFLQIKP